MKVCASGEAPSPFPLPPSPCRLPPSAFLLPPSAFRLPPSAFRPPPSALRPPPSPVPPFRVGGGDAIIPSVKVVIWEKRLPWSVLAAAVPLVLLGWLAIARCGEFFQTRRPLLRRPASGLVGVGTGCYGGGLAAELPRAVPLELLLFLASLGLLLVRLFLSRRSTTLIAGLGTADFSLPRLPRWRLCWRWRDT